MEKCHVFPKLCLSYDELLTALTSQAILCVLARALKQHGRFSARQNRVCPCQLMVMLPNTIYNVLPRHFVSPFPKIFTSA